MPSRAKYTKAFKAMRELGYTSQIVRPVLKNLLEVYEQNWSLIEDDDYTVLVDAILTSEESKVKESQRLSGRFHLRDEPQEAEEDESPLKRSRLRSQTVQALSSTDVASPSSKRKKPLHYATDIISESGGEEVLNNSANCRVIDSETEDKIDTPLQDCQREQKCSSPYSSSELEHTKKIQLVSHEESSGSDPLSPQTQLDDNCNIYTSSSVAPRVINENCTHMLMACPENEKEFIRDNESELDCPLAIVPADHTRLLLEVDCSTAKENFSTSPEVMELDTEDTSAFPEDGSLSAKEFPVQRYCLETKSPNASHLDIASTCKGEVKLSVTFESSLPSSFRVPSLDEVLRLMEEKYLRTYNITRHDFSIVNLMNDICESFLEMGTISIANANERVSCADVQSALVMPRDLDVQAVSNQNITTVVGFPGAPNTIMGTENFRSLIEIRPQLPRFQSLNLSHCKIDLPMKMSQSYKKKNLEALRNLNSSTSQSMVIVQKQHDLSDMLRSAYFVDDITRGGEDFSISLTNEFSNEQQPMFNYIPQNVTYRDACVQFLLARISDDNCCSNCFGDCLISELPCACAGETGGEFAYMPGGLVKEKFLEDFILMKSSPQQKNFFHCQECPLERSKDKSLSGKCKGHLVRKFIKECWYKCGCTKDCGNRVVQRGITRSLQVFMTKEKGWGLRTLEDLPKGAFICEYVGEIVTNTELFNRNTRNIRKKHTYPVLLDADWCTEGVLKDEEALCLDATFYGNVARFINHRCHDANLVEIPVEVETPDHHYYHLAFFTTREVHTLEELTWDYGIDFDDLTHPVEAFHCCCDSKFCRYTKAGNVNRKL